MRNDEIRSIRRSQCEMMNAECGIMKYEVFDEVNAECGIMNAEL